MYGITLGSSECPLFYEDEGERISTFTFAEMKAIISTMLDRKGRNNGIGEFLTDTLRSVGRCVHDFRRNAGTLRLIAQRVSDDMYELRFFGEYPHELVARLNQSKQQRKAVELTLKLRTARRQRHAAGRWVDARPKVLRSLVGANANLKLHFRNTEITCFNAISVIAYAGQHDSHWVRRRLMRSLDERAVASLRLKGGFVFRVDLVYGYRDLLSLTSPVQLRSTNDNRHPAYRRLRRALHKQFNCERKVRVARAEKYRLQRELDRRDQKLFA
jgi:hypothetical protein